MTTPTEAGQQRHTVERLDRWRSLGYGMFIHFSLATFTSDQRQGGVQPITHYNPTELDVDQWVQVARDAGMRYIILSAKHTRDGGFCTWPTKHSEYSVAHSPVKTDVIEAFTKACDGGGARTVGRAPWANCWASACSATPATPTVCST